MNNPKKSKDESLFTISEKDLINYQNSCTERDGKPSYIHFEEFMNWFTLRFASKETDAQVILNKLAEENRVLDANWVMDVIESVCSERGIYEKYPTLILAELTGNKPFFYYGSIQVNGRINLNSELRCSGDVTVKDNIFVNGNFTANIVKAKDIVVNGYILIDEIYSEKNIHANGMIIGTNINAKGNILATKEIHASGHIYANDIKTNKTLICSKSMRVENEICCKVLISDKSQLQYGIYAGLKHQIKDWGISGRVICNHKPDNLISGCFVNIDELKDYLSIRSCDITYGYNACKFHCDQNQRDIKRIEEQNPNFKRGQS